MIPASARNVIPIGITALQRAGNKLRAIPTDICMTATLDALLQISPKRTEPPASDIVIGPDETVYVLSGDVESPELLHSATFQELSNALHRLTQQVHLDAEELAAVYFAVEEARVNH